jgi:hypothetical protein
MSETAAELVEQMVAAGEWPKPELFEAILARGEECIEPLVQVAGRDLHGWPEEAPVYHAIELLGLLRAKAAIAVLAGVLRRSNSEMAQSAAKALG